MDRCSVRENGFTRAHAHPPRWTRSSVEHRPSPALLAPEPYRRERRGSQVLTPVSGRHRNPDRIRDSLNAAPPKTDPEAHIVSPGTSAQLFRSAHAPGGKGLRV